MIVTEKILAMNNIELCAFDEIFCQMVAPFHNYYVSNYGRVIRKTSTKYGFKEVMGSSLEKGYTQVVLSNGKHKKTYKVSRLVAICFCDNPYDDKSYKDLSAHHKDKYIQNNYYKNIMWLSNKDHKLIDSFKRIAIYNENKCTYKTYKDVEQLCKRLEISVPLFCDALRDGVYVHDGKWKTCKINGFYIGTQLIRTRYEKKIF